MGMLRTGALHSSQHSGFPAGYPWVTLKRYNERAQHHWAIAMEAGSKHNRAAWWLFRDGRHRSAVWFSRRHGRKSTSDPDPYTTYTRPVDIKKLTFIHRHLDGAGARKVLELGCGTGPIAMSLAARNHQIKAVDLSAEAVELARAHGVDAQVGDAATFNEGAPYDAVILADVLAEVLNPEKLIANAANNLRLGGLLLLSTPNGYGPFELRANQTGAESG
jgi:2-polyprenyl-3-methyl-5-hydroxy-6-metoxy-1,4-benzoquinol methylase